MQSEELESRLAHLAEALSAANATICAKMNELSLVRRVGDAISAFMSAPELCTELVNAVSESIRCRHAAIYSGPVGSPFRLRALSNVFGTNLSFPETITNSRIARLIANYKMPIRIGDAFSKSSIDPGWPFPSGLPAWLLVPLIEGGNLRGVFCLADDQPNTFSDETERTMLVVVPQIANALAKIGLYEGVRNSEIKYRTLVEQVVRAQKMESVGTLAAGVAHDFNNILGIIMPNAELIKMRTPLDPAVSKHADVIITASRRANQLTKQMLSLARRDPRQVRTINLNESIRATCGLFEQTIGKRIRVQLEFESDPVYIRADDSQMEQILLNLAINARDAMPNGGTLGFRTGSDGGQITLRIIDTGTGIRKEILPNIFDPFFTTKDKSKGTGLGLSVVYSLVKQIGGTIEVRSEVGSGTEFILTFPAHFDAPEQPVVKLEDPAGGNESILVVDDEPEMRKLLETVLKSIGYNVVCAANGMEAVEKVSSEFHLVIMDMMMPVMDGLTAVHLIRQKLPQIKILVASGYTTEDNFPTLHKIRVEGFVQKPFELHKLAHLIRDVLDGVAA